MKQESKPINLPEELIENGTKVIKALQNSKNLHRTRGLNITQLAKQTGLSKYALNRLLGALETARVVECEKQGSSTVYYCKNGEY